MKRLPGRPKGSGTRPLAERFQAFVTIKGKDVCWEWTGSKSKDGHGRIWDGKTVIPAHHAAYIIAHGERPPEGTYLRRSCTDPCALDYPTPQLRREFLEHLSSKERSRFDKLRPEDQNRRLLKFIAARRAKLCMNPDHFVVTPIRKNPDA